MKLWRKPLAQDKNAVATHHISIDKERCKGCSYCTDLCPREALVMSSELNQKGYRIASISDESKCLACGFCEAICPEFAIHVYSDNSVNKQSASETSK